MSSRYFDRSDVKFDPGSAVKDLNNYKFGRDKYTYSAEMVAIPYEYYRTHEFLHALGYPGTFWSSLAGVYFTGLVIAKRQGIRGFAYWRHHYFDYIGLLKWGSFAFVMMHCAGSATYGDFGLAMRRIKRKYRVKFVHNDPLGMNFDSHFFAEFKDYKNL